MHLLTKLALAIHVGFGHLLEDAKRRPERGVTAAEYGLILALVAVAIIVAVTALGGSLSSIFDSASSAIGG